MSDPTDFLNCGFCGDRHRYDLPHECWAYDKTQTQENLLAICPVCFEPINLPHWRCEGIEQTTHPVVG